jgi:S1-C subfamily serine protease
MKNAISSVLFAVSLLFLTVPNFGCAASAVAAQRADQARIEKSFDFNRLAAVTIHAYGTVDGKTEQLWLGSGIFLGVGGLVLTNNHVAADGTDPPHADLRLEVCLVSEGVAKPCVPAEVLALDPDDDLALLRTTFPDVAPIRIRPDAEPMREAEDVYARPSFGIYLVPSLVYGRFVGRWLSDGTDLYDLAVMPGSSGGPVFDLQGRLVGLIHAMTTEKGTSFNVAIPAQVIREFLKEHADVVWRSLRH